jgi:hypothetical protein
VSRVAVGLDRATDMLAAAVQVPAPEGEGDFWLRAAPDAGAATVSSATTASARDLSVITTAPFPFERTRQL